MRNIILNGQLLDIIIIEHFINHKLQNNFQVFKIITNFGKVLPLNSQNKNNSILKSYNNNS